MRTKLLITAALLMSVFLFLGGITEKKKLHSYQSPPVPLPDNGFIIGGMANAWNIHYNFWYDSLGMNTYHMYTNPKQGWLKNQSTLEFQADDTLGGNMSSYGANVQDWISDNNSREIRTLMDRPTIEYLAYGQRSDYQAEATHEDGDYWFYTYNNSVNNSINVSDGTDPVYGNKGKHCYPDASSGAMANGYILSGLKANREQANRSWNWHNNDDSFPWYVKPRIRVDSAFVQNNENDTICRIDILDWDGDTVKKVGILGRHFKNTFGAYDGRYLEEFNFDGDEDLVIPTGAICPGPNRNGLDWWNVPVHTDFRVYWYGTCEMWLDYVRVENQPSVELHNNDWIDQIDNEVNWALEGYNPSDPVPNNFYIEEFEFNITPSIRRVNELIDSLSDGKLTMMVNLNYELYNTATPNYFDNFHSARQIKKYLIDGGKVKNLVLGAYALEGWTSTEHSIYSPKSYHPTTLHSGNYDALTGVLSYSASVSGYENWLQENMEGDFPKHFDGIMTLSDSLLKLSNNDLRIVNLHQSHLWWQRTHKLKEPSNEEIEMMGDLSISYGAKGILYFIFQGRNDNMDTANNYYYRGIMDDFNATVPRTSNAYGQDKFAKYKTLIQKYKKWTPYIVSFDDANRKTYRYYKSGERSAMESSTFMDSLKAFPPVEFAPDPIDPDLDLLPPDPANTTYVQAAFFNTPGETEHNKYFMVVNRRCAPYIDSANSDNLGGRRLIAFYPDETFLPGFNNWKVINLEDSSTVWTFDKNSNSPVYLGDFMPGEGKLFKLAPVMQEGGTLVVNENVTGQTFDCKGEVLNNGKNVSLKSSVISFTEDGTITMTGGVFSSGQLNTPTDSVVFKAKNSDWQGISLFGCDTVRMFYSNFSGLENISGNSLLLLSECYETDIRNSRFDVTTNTNVYAINSSFNFITEPSDPSVLFKANLFLTNGNKTSTVRVLSNSAAVLPVIFEGNYFYGNKPEPEAIFLENTVGGAIKQNTISGYGKGITMLSSSLDIYGNTITTNMTGSITGYNIYGAAGSVISMQPSGLYYTGGINNLSFTGSSIPNIIVEGAIFKMTSGANSFNISASDTSHLYGYFPNSTKSHPTNATGNCFNVAGSNTNAIANVTNGSGGSPISFTFAAYNCGGSGSSVKGDGSLSEISYITVPIGDNYNDTVFMRTEGEMDIYGLLDLETRKRNYDSVITLAKSILNNADSIQSPGAIQKLYLASLMLNDENNTTIGDVKTYFEQLILDNPGNDALIERAFYFIQKCKVVLGDYESAMDGFADIVNQNPYTYEGLVASWDYSATSLLQGGTGGGYKEPYGNKAQNLFTLKSFFDGDPKSDKKDNYDKTKFSTNDRQIIKENIKNTFVDKRTKRLREVREVEEGSTRDPMKKKELKKMNDINNAAVVKEADDIKEHIKRVNSDIDVVFGQSEADDLTRKEQNTIPSEFELSQNFPNPFNPTTKIQFALPMDGKVQLVIYDILGREVAKLVNNEFRTAGRYVNEFNGSRLASGVYFYRISVDEGKAFNQVKKMVLLK